MLYSIQLYLHSISWSSNTIVGGKGDDVLEGGTGSDVYEWNLGDGNDRIKDLAASEYLYFVYSYHVVCEDDAALGFTEYGYKFVSAVRKDNIFGFQPHPEKSYETGLKILRNFGEM